ncbi:MAG: hypothetical protein F6K42_20570 [Leptolyngbya sp. SIO1D8]|nr:hypothetical protein [Leptolyngbya sp. SIO1D8]
MAKLLVRSLSATAVVAASFAISPTAFAQEPPASRSADVPTAITEIFYGNSGPFFRNRTSWRYGDFILGVGGFSEREISMDVDAISRATHFLMDEQATSDPTIRVPDLFNPYNTSVQFLPVGQANSRASGSEFVFETFPRP